MPAEMRSLIPRRLRTLKAVIEPSSPEDLGVNVERLFSFLEAFGIQPTTQTITGVVSAYREALSDLPSWAVAEAISSIIKTWRYQSIPKPADIRANVPDSFYNARTEASRLQTAMMFSS